MFFSDKRGNITVLYRKNEKPRLKKEVSNIAVKDGIERSFDKKKKLSYMSNINALLDISNLLDALPFYVLIVDEHHNILHANEAVRKHLGVNPEDIVGGYCPKVIHGLDEPFYGCPLEEAVELGHAVEREVFDADTERWVCSSIYPTKVFTEEGDIVFFHMVTDITDRKLAEEQLKDSHDKLRRLSAHLESLGEEERKKIARDLHDETGQLLASMTAHLGAAVAMLPDSEYEIKSILKNVELISANVIDQLQKVTYELRPLVLDDLGLVSAVKWLIDNNLKTAGFKTSFKTFGQVRRINRQLETTIFRVIQEAVNNIIRHSQADKVKIHISFLKYVVRVTVSDNGRGFDLDEALNSNEGFRGLGLLGMKERIEILNGTFDITSDSVNGTRIAFKISLHDNNMM